MPHIPTKEKPVDGEGGCVPVGHGGDDVFRPVGGVATKEHLGQCGLECAVGQNRQPPLSEGDAQVAFDPGKSVGLAYRQQHFVAGKKCVGLTRGNQAARAVGVVFGAHDFEGHAGEAAVLVHEGFGHMQVDDRNAFLHGVFLFPLRGLHFLKSAAHDHLDVLAAHAARRAAAVHGRVAAAQHDDALADAVNVAKVDRGQPFDADVDVCARFLAPGQIQILSVRGAAAHEDGVVAGGQQSSHGVDALPALEGDALQIEHIAGFFVQYAIGQTKARNARAHESARLCFGIEHRHVIAQWRQIASHRERGRPCAHTGNAFAVGWLTFGHSVQDVILVVGRHAFEPADGDRFGMGGVALFHAQPAAGWFAGTVAGAAQNSRENVGDPVDHVGIGVAALGNQPDVLRHRRMRRTGPLAVNHLVVPVGVAGV